MTVAFKTFGCRLNHAETAQFEADFKAAGFTRVPFGAPADILVVHSCAVTQKAENEGLKLLRSLRQRFPDACLVLAGCTVEAAAADTLGALALDLAVPRELKDRLVPLVLQHLRPDLPPPAAATPFAHAPLTPSTQRAALKIQDGCDFFCSYCIVPHTRGRATSRPFAACLEEARALLGAGFQELVVTGCNIACYSDRGRTLVELLAALLELPGLGRLRLGSLEPGTVEREVVSLMAASPKLCRFLHLPLQSGDNGVLERMGRRYRIEEAVETVGRALELMPLLGLGADLIAGFPGETEEAFARTRALLDRLPFSNLHVFPYSERPGTPAAALDGRLPLALRQRRAAELIAQGKRSRAAFASRFAGGAATLLVERFDKEGVAHGWSGEYLPCAVRGVPRERRRQLVAFAVLCGFCPA